MWDPGGRKPREWHLSFLLGVPAWVGVRMNASLVACPGLCMAPLLGQQRKGLPHVLPFVPAWGLDMGILQPPDSPRVVVSFVSEMLFSWRVRGRTVIIVSLCSASLPPHLFFFSPLSPSFHCPFSPFSISFLSLFHFLPRCPFYPWSLVSCHFLLSLLILFFKPFISILAQMVVSWGWGIPVHIWWWWDYTLMKMKSEEVLYFFAG